MAVDPAEEDFEEEEVEAITLDAVILVLLRLAIPPISSKIPLRRPSGGLKRKLMVSRAVFIWLMLS